MTNHALPLVWMMNWPTPGAGQKLAPILDEPGRPPINHGAPKVRMASGAIFCCIHSWGAQFVDSTVSLLPPLGVTRILPPLDPLGSSASFRMLSSRMCETSVRRFLYAGMMLRRESPISDELFGDQAVGVRASN